MNYKTYVRENRRELKSRGSGVGATEKLERAWRRWMGRR